MNLLTMGTESNKEKTGAEYLSQLLKDKKQIQAFPNVFLHLERILDEGEQHYNIQILKFLKLIILINPCDFTNHQP